MHIIILIRISQSPCAYSIYVYEYSLRNFYLHIFAPKKTSHTLNIYTKHAHKWFLFTCILCKHCLSNFQHPKILFIEIEQLLEAYAMPCMPMSRWKRPTSHTYTKSQTQKKKKTIITKCGFHSKRFSRFCDVIVRYLFVSHRILCMCEWI